MAAPSGAANGAFPQNFNPETTPGYPNTFSTKDVLKPACPQALAGTPGSDPATKVINTGAGITNDFTPGGTVHYVYTDNPHTNGGTQNFTIQDCVVVYPAGFFSASDFDPTTGVLTSNFKKNQLTKGGTQIDGASLSGIASSVGPIYYSWTAPGADVAPIGSYVCNFARDIKNNHGGGGNRKVPPTCYQVQPPPPPPPPPVDVPAQIYVGYVDEFHGASVHPTSPWLGDPNVTFVGCTPEGTSTCPMYDAGAILITNPAGNVNSLTLTGASVQIGPCNFTPWGTPGPLGMPQTIAPGQSLILTQTSNSPAPAPCDTGIDPALTGRYNFDTSEYPNEIRGGPYNCTNNGLLPKISLTFTGSGTVTLVDRNQVLNTGGIDGAACGTGQEGTSSWAGPIGP